MNQILLSYLLVQLSLLLNVNIYFPCETIGCSIQCNKIRQKREFGLRVEASMCVTRWRCKTVMV